ncbi:inositol monophosphatase family protein [Kribbella sp. NPDC050124]|uniref:inositol monophosphatase family protein n=1 Tax=Kribbella sp. NPDC050124 TaxID=3364114 RepID=UPI0037B5C8AB
MTVQALSDVAREAAAAGAGVIRERLAARSGFGVDTKSAGHDLVTDVDRASEAAVLGVIRRRRPDDAVLGEETGEHPGTTGVRWLVDPLDGTTNFVHGRIDFAVAVAAQVEGQVVAAAIHRPMDDEWLVGGTAGISASSGEPSCSSTTELKDALIGIGFPYDLQLRVHAHARIGELIPRIRDFRRSGSAACDFLAIATGRLDAFVGFGLAEWDYAAGRALVPAAGGVWHDFVGVGGKPSVIAGAKDVVIQLRTQLGSVSGPV